MNHEPTAADSMQAFYARRAPEYERVYSKPERQEDLGRLGERVGEVFAGLDVLELACGTGWWTRWLAGSARSVLATDLTPEVLAIARRKDYGDCRVTFQVGDAYSPPADTGCNAGFHAFWWSHVPLGRLRDFLTALHSVLPAGAPVMLMDNRYVEGSSTPIHRRDEEGNTYQLRRLEDGSEHELLKNFPTREDLRHLLSPHTQDLLVTELPYYWVARYTVP